MAVKTERDWNTVCLCILQKLKRDLLYYKRANTDCTDNIEHYDVLPQSRLHTIESAVASSPTSWLSSSPQTLTYQQLTPVRDAGLASAERMG